MALRITLALCVAVGGALCGKAMADAARRRARTLAALAEGLRALRIHMTGMFEPVRNALERCDCPLMALVAEAMEGGASAAEAWRRVERRASRRGGPIDALTAEDRQVLERLFGGLGESGRDEQEALLNAALQAVEALRAPAESKAREADRLYVSLGLLVGLMLALVVI